MSKLQGQVSQFDLKKPGFDTFCSKCHNENIKIRDFLLQCNIQKTCKVSVRLNHRILSHCHNKPYTTRIDHKNKLIDFVAAVTYHKNTINNTWKENIMKNRYMICYSIITEESAERGDYAESGIIGEPDSLYFALRELFETRTNAVDGMQDISASWHNGRLTIYVSNGMEFETGEHESRSLHRHNITRSSATRIARAAGVTLN